MTKKTKEQIKFEMTARLRSELEPHKDDLVEKFGEGAYDAVFEFKSDRETVTAMLRFVQDL